MVSVAAIMMTQSSRTYYLLVFLNSTFVNSVLQYWLWDCIGPAVRCKRCNDLGACLECDDSFLTDDGSCSSTPPQCTSGLYLVDPASSTTVVSCRSCPVSNCSLCSSLAPHQCELCDTSYVFSVNSTCVLLPESCSSGYYVSSEATRSTSIHCLQCLSCWVIELILLTLSVVTI